MGSKTDALRYVQRAKIIQTISKSRKTTVTYKRQKGSDRILVFVTNVYRNDLPISTYLNLNDIQAIISKEELIKCCMKSMDDGDWKFNFWMKDENSE